MRQKIFIIFLGLILPLNLFGHQLNKVSSKTAILSDAKHIDIGIFQPLRYGVSKNMEISIHPIAFFISPNLQLKKSFKTINGFAISSQHKFYYPTPLLKMISREGTGGIIAKEFKDGIPQMFSLYNGVLLSKKISDKNLLTLKSGLKFAINSQDLDSRTTIDLPLVYPRMQVFYETFALQYGIDVVSHIAGNFYSDANFEIFHCPGSDENVAIEFSNMYSWLKSEKTQISLGFKIVGGKYPFGSQTHLLPMFDIKWTLR